MSTVERSTVITLSVAIDTLTLQDLCDQASVSARTVRYYIQQGLLPPAEGSGPGTSYGKEHLDRLQLVLRLKNQHLPLAEIRRRLDGLSPEDVVSLLQGPGPVEAESAADYVRAVLAGKSAPVRGPTSPSPALNTATRSTWERHTITPEIELHIQRPLSRSANRRVKILLQHAHDLFSKEDH